MMIFADKLFIKSVSNTFIFTIVCIIFQLGIGFLLALFFHLAEHEYHFPVEVNRADYQTLLRVPGIGYKSASRIVKARRMGTLQFEDLKKMGVVLKRALYFLTCNGRMMYPTKIEEDYIMRNLLNTKKKLPDSVTGMTYKQLSLFDDPGTGRGAIDFEFCAEEEEQE